MPREVIDLLSSPEQSALSFRKVTVNGSSTYESKATLPPALNCDSPKQNDSPKQRDVDWVTLSSDNEEAIRTSLKPAINASFDPHLKSVMRPSDILKAQLPAKTSFADRGVYFHSDDFDTSVDLDSSINQIEHPRDGLLGFNRRQMEEDRLLRAKQRKGAENLLLYKADNHFLDSDKALQPEYIESAKSLFHASSVTSPLEPSNSTRRNGHGFCVLSAASDITIDLDDDPFVSPPAKRRRLSSSPITSSSKPINASRYRRSISNIEFSTRSGGVKGNPTNLQMSNKLSKYLESDPIVFTSSPDNFADARQRNKAKQYVSHIGENDDDIFEDKIFNKAKVPADDIDASSDESLPEISNIRKKTACSTLSKRPGSAMEKYEAGKAAMKKKEEQASEKIRKDKERKALKEAKEAEKERKRQEKEEKAREKQKDAELAKVNILKTDKKISALEMIVDLPRSLDAKLSSQVQTFLQANAIEHEEYDNSQPIVRWRRKIVSQYNEDLGYWDKVKPHIEIEKHVMYVMPAKEFVDLAIGEEGDELDLHVAGIKSQSESCKLIYLIEGIETWKRKNKSLRERQFKNAVRSHVDQEEPSATQRPRKKKEAEYIDEDVIEDALLKLQMLDTKVHHTETMVITAEWVLAFTLHISTIPYKYGIPLLLRNILRQIIELTLCNIIIGLSCSLTIQLSAWNQVKSKLEMDHQTPL